MQQTYSHPYERVSSFEDYLEIPAYLRPEDTELNPQPQVLCESCGTELDEDDYCPTCEEVRPTRCSCGGMLSMHFVSDEHDHDMDFMKCEDCWRAS